MVDWLKSWFKRRRADPPSPASGPAVGWIRARVRVDDLVPKLKAPKDIIVQVSRAGWVASTCKACAEAIQPKPKDGFLWMICPRCGGVSFLVLANLPRDVAFAEQEADGVFEYELFFCRELVPGRSPL